MAVLYTEDSELGIKYELLDWIRQIDKDNTPDINIDELEDNLDYIINSYLKLRGFNINIIRNKNMPNELIFQIFRRSDNLRIFFIHVDWYATSLKVLFNMMINNIIKSL